MKGHELLEKLLQSYQAAFDITRPYDVEGERYEAYAAFNVTSAKYVLVKKAELWRADCFEHTFFSCIDRLKAEDIQRFRGHIVSFIEPELVRNGEACTCENHMYTYITAVFISERGLTKEAEKAVRDFKFFKNYRLGLRGYAEARVLVFDMENRRVSGNRAARELVKGYEKVF